MKTAQLITKSKIHLLFNHILDGFEKSHAGIDLLSQKQIISKEEYTELLQKNAARLIERVHEFKITYKIVSLFFVILFTWLQCTGEEMDMRRSSRTRTGRRRNETETTL